MSLKKYMKRIIKLNGAIYESTGKQSIKTI